MNSKQIKKILKQHLSEKRFFHTLCVCEMAKKLAVKYNANQETIEQAALFHDIFKCFDTQKLLQIADEYGIIICNKHLNSPALYHSIVGAHYIKKQYNVSDEVFNAVFYHTMAKENMTLAEKIIYVADCVSTDRNYKDREKYEKLAFENIDKAVFEILKYTICDIINKNGYICDESISAYNYYNNLLNVNF